MIKYEIVLDAYESASMGPQGEIEAFLNKATGHVYFHFVNGDNFEDPPEDLESDKYIELPTKNDLDLGKFLAIDFAVRHLPDDADDVEDMFYRKGAYSQFRKLLIQRDALDAWYKFEKEKTDVALRQWCKSESIELA